MEEEFIRNQERLKPQEEKHEVCYWCPWKKCYFNVYSNYTCRLV